MEEGSRDLEILERKAEVFKALGQPLRLAIVEYLRAGEHCVQEIVAELGADQSNVSRHLAVLRHAGVVRPFRRGLCVYYRLAIEALPHLCDEIGGAVRLSPI